MIRSQHLGAIAERPKVVKKQEKKQEPANLIICANCQQKRKKCALGLCAPCYVYQSRNGTPRPLHLIETEITKKDKARWCMTCGNPDLYTISRCAACHFYWRRHKKARPKRYWDKDFRCVVCGFPKKAARKRTCGKGINFRGDMCDACYHYQDKFDKPRPAYLWGAGKYGFCDCGYPAEHEIEKIAMCNRCVKEYK